MSFIWAAGYAWALSLLILSGNATDALLCLFCRRDEYTLGNFGQIWANWHAVGCAFVGLSNWCVVRDTDGTGFGPAGRRAVALNTAFLFGAWGVQNLHYCVERQDLFTPLMWINAIACLTIACASLWTRAQIRDAPTGGKKQN